MGFQHLFTPLQIGPVKVRNRILFNSHATHLGENWMPAERVKDYHVERAKGGAGLQSMGCTPVHVSGVRRAPGFYCFSDDIIPYYRKLSEAVHEYDGRIMVQYFHASASAESDVSMMPLWAPSARQSGGVAPSIDVPKAMEIEDIEEVINAFAQAARRAKEGGLDGVELHFTNTNALLIGSFLSPLSNKRTDEYGGSLDNRLRLPLEIIDRVRNIIGNSDMILGIRISGDELLPDGLNQDDMKVVAQRFAATRKIDYINVTIGSRAHLSLVVPPMAVPLGFQVYLAAGIKDVVDIPVFTVGRINDPVQAEEILANGYADMIGMVRALICDPELPNKTREGRLDDIRKCIACNQACQKRIWDELPISCVQNPAAGREKDLGIGTISQAVTRKKVLIAGGGPSGMEAARIAAIRGHEVMLYEREKELGGQMQLAAKAPYQQDIQEVHRFLGVQIKKLGVNINLGIEVTPAIIEKEKPDVVVVATGSTPERTGY
ncbi:FAD-dependent oxidoreductase, partial [Chloroflexota bacterium]